MENNGKVFRFAFFSVVALALEKKKRESFYDVRKRLAARVIRGLGEPEYSLPVEDFVGSLTVAYAENLDEAVSLYEESSISQKTTWGKMSEVYKRLPLTHNNPTADNKRRVYELIRDAEIRREQRSAAAD